MQSWPWQLVCTRLARLSSAWYIIMVLYVVDSQFYFEIVCVLKTL